MSFSAVPNCTSSISPSNGAAGSSETGSVFASRLAPLAGSTAPSAAGSGATAASDLGCSTVEGRRVLLRPCGKTRLALALSKIIPRPTFQYRLLLGIRSTKSIAPILLLRSAGAILMNMPMRSLSFWWTTGCTCVPFSNAHRSSFRQNGRLRYAPSSFGPSPVITARTACEFSTASCIASSLLLSISTCGSGNKRQIARCEVAGSNPSVAHPARRCSRAP